MTTDGLGNGGAGPDDRSQVGPWQGLVADIGGTHARMAMVDAQGVMGPIDQVVHGHGDQGPDSPEELLRSFLDRRGGERPADAVLAVAGPVSDGQVLMSNRGCRLSGQELGERLGIRNVHLVNDFEALAHPLDQLPADACIPVPGGEAATNQMGTPPPQRPTAPGWSRVPEPALASPLWPTVKVRAGRRLWGKVGMRPSR